LPRSTRTSVSPEPAQPRAGQIRIDEAGARDAHGVDGRAGLQPAAPGGGCAGLSSKRGGSGARAARDRLDTRRSQARAG
jgi:hypothetical protein